MRGLGTLINAGAIVAAGIVGIIFKRFIKDRYQETMLKATGFMVMFMGAAGTLSKMLVINNDRSISTIGTMNILLSLAFGALIGEILDIEVTSYAGKTLYVTSGHLGDVLKESIDVAFGYIKSNISFFKVNENSFRETIHINFREGGVPKDGPSAGIDITTALLSHLLNTPIEPTISMSGEITLLGDVLPVGGLREKVLAAKRNGIRTIFLSKDNEKDINELPDEAKKGIEFIFVMNYKEIYLYLFGGKKWKKHRELNL